MSAERSWRLRRTCLAHAPSARSSTRNDRAAEGSGRGRRREQPACHAAKTGNGCIARGILYAPDYVINAGGIINVCTEYLGDGDRALSVSGSKEFRFGSSRSGQKASRSAATRRRSPTLWRSASSEGHKQQRNARARKSRPVSSHRAPVNSLAVADRARLAIAE